MFDRQAHFEAGVAGLGLEFDFTAVPVGHNAIADHQTQNVAGTGNNLQITARPPRPMCLPVTTGHGCCR